MFFLLVYNVYVRKELAAVFCDAIDYLNHAMLSLLSPRPDTLAHPSLIPHSLPPNHPHHHLPP